MTLQEHTVGGLHDFLLDTVLPRHPLTGRRALDLGAGSGALAVRLGRLGFSVVGADRDREHFAPDVPFVRLSLDEPDFATQLAGTFDLVTAVEVIEHLENPIGFLRGVSRLLRPAGIAILTTPNMENAPTRVKFLLTGKLHMMDALVPHHVSPIFYDLFIRQYLPRAGLALAAYHAFPSRGYKHPRLARPLSALAHLLPGPAVHGDAHVFVLRGADEADGGQP